MWKSRVSGKQQSNGHRVQQEELIDLARVWNIDKGRRLYKDDVLAEDMWEHDVSTS